MSTQHEESGTGWPQPAEPPAPATPPDPRPDAPPADGVPPGPCRKGESAPPVDPAPDVDPEPADRQPDDRAADSGPGGPVGEPAPVTGPRRPSAAGVMIVVLLVLLGFTLVVQLKTNSTDPALGATRQEDLVRILSDLEAQQQRLQQDVAGLEDSQRQLTSGAQGRQAALDEATRRADELGVLAGTLPARGPGLTVRFVARDKPIAASALLDAVQELRGAGAEAMQIAGPDGRAVRVVASTYFLDADGGVDVGGQRLTGPYTLTVIGDPETMRTALNIAGGVVASVDGDGGNVIVNEHEVVDVDARSNATDLKYARPVG